MTRRTAIGISEAAGVRYLHFGDDNVQGAMRVARPWKLELEYTREMLFPLLLMPPAQWPREVLLIGLGPGSLLKFLHRHLPAARLHVVEISPEVVAMAQQYFRLPHDPARIEISIGDGADIVANDQRRYDLILVDGYDAAARCGRLASDGFHQLCRQRLTAHGYCAFNLLGHSRGFPTAWRRVRNAFPHTLLLPIAPSGNAIALGHPQPMSLVPRLLQEHAHQLRAATGLDLRLTLRRLYPARTS